MNKAKDDAYIRGGESAWRLMLGMCLHNLRASDDHEGDLHRWRLERGAAIAMLRQMCEVYGDNDWPDNLHLADIIEKHLCRYMAERDS